jgi:hypothetical protein
MLGEAYLIDVNVVKSSGHSSRKSNVVCNVVSIPHHEEVNSKGDTLCPVL